jgi:hypothetical protein
MLPGLALIEGRAAGAGLAETALGALADGPSGAEAQAANPTAKTAAEKFFIFTYFLLFIFLRILFFASMSMMSTQIAAA